MDTKTNPLTWIALRSSDDTFMKFMKAQTPEAAVEAATKRCTPSPGEPLNTVEFDRMKEEYLAELRAAWGLPAGAGV